MKEEIINSIIMMLTEMDMDIDTEEISGKLYFIMRNVQITKIETELAVREDAQNEQYIKRFIAAKMVKGCTPRTVAMYRKEITKIIAKFGKPCTDITPDDIRLYIAVRLTQDGISKVTANNELRYLRTFYSWLSAEEIISKNPLNKIDSIKQNKVKKKAFSEMECEKIRQACKTSMETAIVEVFLSTCCRVSELCMMRIDEIKDGTIVVHGKGNKDRTVYLNAKAELALQKYLADRKDGNPYIFPPGKFLMFQKGGKKVSRSHPDWYTNPELVSDGFRDKGGIEATVRKIGKRAGVENTHPHRFRRTGATLALRRGMPIELVSKMLGHEQISTTQIYLDLNDDDMEAAHRKYVV